MKNRARSADLAAAMFLMLLFYVLFCSMATAENKRKARNAVTIKYEICYDPPVAEPEPQEAAFNLLKQYEGFLASPRWDVNAYRNGYGTPAKSKEERISEAEADRRARKIYQRHATRIAKKYPGLTEHQTAVLAVMRYNVGSFGPKLRRALRTGDNESIAAAMLLYVKSQGEVLPGLVSRRSAEVALLMGEANFLALS